ncbi:MAG: hypothetical protein R2795_14070 [Saprospiraceae bacterium]
MSQSKTFLTVIGFLLAGIGFLAIFLALVGVDFTFLYWTRHLGALASFGLKIAMILIGFILIFFGQTDLDKEEIF